MLIGLLGGYVNLLLLSGKGGGSNVVLCVFGLHINKRTRLTSSV